MSTAPAAHKTYFTYTGLLVGVLVNLRHRRLYAAYLKRLQQQLDADTLPGSNVASKLSNRGGYDHAVSEGLKQNMSVEDDWVSGHQKAVLKAEETQRRLYVPRAPHRLRVSG